MTLIAALAVCLTVKVTFAEECPNTVTCPCGNKGKNVTVCVPPAAHIEVCTRLSKCEACDDGLSFCTKCPDGLKGPSCSRAAAANSCYPPDKPTFGSKRCVPRKKPRFCIGKCFPGYYFRESESEDEMTLTCSGGVWTPQRFFPDCESAGECDLVSLRTGSSNCTTGMDGTRCIVHCNDKYMGRFACYPGNSWIPTLPLCVRPKAEFTHGLYCDRLEPISNGKVQYFAPGDGGKNGTGQILDYEIDEFPEGSVAEYSCNEGFLIQGSDRLSCETAGFWSAAEPKCVRAEFTDGLYCDRLEPISNGKVQYFAPGDGGKNGTGQIPDYEIDEFPKGSVAEYSCNEGFLIQGSDRLSCETAGFWSAAEPKCVRAEFIDRLYCDRLEPISNGKVQYFAPGDGGKNGTGQILDYKIDEFPEGSVAEYSCNEGFLIQGSDRLTCETTGFWSAVEPKCIPDEVLDILYCDNPGPIPNGKVEYFNTNLPHRNGESLNHEQDEFPGGSVLEYSCDEGFGIQGNHRLVCEETGFWSTEVPKCVAADINDVFSCDNPGRVLNGRMWYYAPGVRERNGTGVRLDKEMDEYPAGSILEYTCDKGFRLTGSHSLKCEESTGFWTAQRPRCDGDCGQSFLKTSVRIRDGQQTMIGEWPWVVSISLQEEDSARFVCGGAVFNTRSVVTAAHCLEEGRTYILRFGKHHFRIEDDDPHVLVRTSIRVIIHPDYSRKTLDSDIGLILFEQAIEYSARVQPICLPTFETTVRNIRTGKVGYVSGWGDTELELPSDTLLFAGLPVLSPQDCVESYRKQNLSVSITGNMFCAGYHNGTYSVCGGDSGSPFVFYDNLFHRYTMEGLVSFVVRKRADAQVCGLPGRFAIFTKVFRFVPWMYQTIE